MRHPFVKALALVLAALAVAGAYWCLTGVMYLVNADLYEKDVDSAIQSAFSWRAEALACNLANRYAEQTYSNVPENVQRGVGVSYDDEDLSWRADLNTDTWYYTLQDLSGKELESTVPEDADKLYEYSYTVTGRYLMQTNEANGDIYYSSGTAQWFLVYADSPEYQVTVYLQENSITSLYGLDFTSARLFHSQRYTVIVMMGIFAAVFLVCLVYLCIAAGRRRKNDPVRPGGLNRLPLDLYLIGAGALCCACVAGSIEINPMVDLYRYNVNAQSEWFLLQGLCSGGLMFLAGLILSAFLFALAAQCKAPEHFWWRSSVLCHALKLIGWLLSKLLACCLRAFRFLLEMYRMLPVIWQWLVTGCGMVFFVVVSIFMQSMPLFLLSLLTCLAVILYGAWAFGRLLKGAQQMAQGSLRAKIPVKNLSGAFKTHAENLNALSDVTVEAADVRLRSERMKAELITNVSHDIKTPLTSIINYVDLLQRTDDESQKGEYLQILDKQSQRLKKLIEDLTEMSRASTGNIQTNIAPMDAVEGITQALGEFSDKLTLANLCLCTDLPEEPVMIEADGRLFWRVMSNLLSNVVKYAMPGTRVYVRLTRQEEVARISVKNISREPLTKDARELTERFVRGDASRNTEGSGLGLSIAGSLMDVQKGGLQVQVDADLFTAELTFPTVMEMQNA